MLLSTRIGDVLELRPWPAVGCLAMSVQIGYLVSATMPNLGGFRISCPVCQCVKKPTVYEKLFPFPEVQTNVPGAKIVLPPIEELQTDPMSREDFVSYSCFDAQAAARYGENWGGIGRSREV